MVTTRWSRQRSPEPAARSRTTPETRISPAPARAAMRSATCTASPTAVTLPTSISPAMRCRCSTRSAQSRSPSRAAARSGRTSGATSSVASTRSASAAPRAVVRNSSIASTTRSMSPVRIGWSRPLSSTKRAPGLRSARKRPAANLTHASSRRCSTTVGTRIAPSTPRTSIVAFICASAIAAVGLTEGRSNRAHQALKCGSCTRPGAKLASEVPVPQLCSAPRTKAVSRSGLSTALWKCA